MKHTLRRLVAGTVMAVAIVGSTGVPAKADHTVVGAHYGTYKWWNTQYWGYRAVWILDRSADPVVGAALREFIVALNADSARRGLSAATATT